MSLTIKRAKPKKKSKPKMIYQSRVLRAAGHFKRDMKGAGFFVGKERIYDGFYRVYVGSRKGCLKTYGAGGVVAKVEFRYGGTNPQENVTFVEVSIPAILKNKVSSLNKCLDGVLLLNTLNNWAEGHRGQLQNQYWDPKSKELLFRKYLISPQGYEKRESHIIIGD